jgi:hypothetical protein
MGAAGMKSIAQIANKTFTKSDCESCRDAKENTINPKTTIRKADNHLGSDMRFFNSRIIPLQPKTEQP